MWQIRLILNLPRQTPPGQEAGANQAVIRTDPSSPSNVGNYAYELYLRNPSASALTNYAAISGNGTVKYIEGKLRRQVNAAATYDFPVGFTPGYKDGMEGFSIKFNSAPTSKSILGHIEDQSQAVLYRNILCDVGKDPGPGDDPCVIRGDHEQEEAPPSGVVRGGDHSPRYR